MEPDAEPALRKLPVDLGTLVEIDAVDASEYNPSSPPERW